jgi:hypothetical protein
MFDMIIDCFCFNQVLGVMGGYGLWRRWRRALLYNALQCEAASVNIGWFVSVHVILV